MPSPKTNSQPDCDDLCTCGHERFAHMVNEIEEGHCHAHGCACQQFAITDSQPDEQRQVVGDGFGIGRAAREQMRDAAAKIYMANLEGFLGGRVVLRLDALERAEAALAEVRERLRNLPTWNVPIHGDVPGEILIRLAEVEKILDNTPTPEDPK